MYYVTVINILMTSLDGYDRTSPLVTLSAWGVVSQPLSWGSHVSAETDTMDQCVEQSILLIDSVCRVLINDVSGLLIISQLCLLLHHNSRVLGTFI